MKPIPFFLLVVFFAFQGVSSAFAQENQRFFDDIYYTPSNPPASSSEEADDRGYTDSNFDNSEEYARHYEEDEPGYYTRQIHRFYRPSFSFGYFSGLYGPYGFYDPFYNPWWGPGPYWARPGVSVHFGMGWGSPYWGYPSWGYAPYYGYYGFYGGGYGGYWPGYYHGFYDGYHHSHGLNGRQVNYGPRINQINPRSGRQAAPASSRTPRAERPLRQANPSGVERRSPNSPASPNREPARNLRMQERQPSSPNLRRSTPPPASPGRRIQTQPPRRTQPSVPSGGRRAPSMNAPSSPTQRYSAPSQPRYSAPASRPAPSQSTSPSSGGSRGGRR